jgi:hypothetical protein
MDSSDDDQITKPKTTAKPVTNVEEPKPKKTYARKAKDVVQNTLKGTAKGKQPKNQKDVLAELECDLEREEALLQRLEEKASKRKALQAEIRKPNIPTSEESIVDDESESDNEPPKKQKSTKKGITKPVIPEDKPNKINKKISNKITNKVVEPETDSESESDVSIIEEIIVKKKKKPKAEPKPQAKQKKKKVVRKIIEVSDSDTDTGSDSDGTPPQPTTRATKSQQNRVTKVIPQLPQSKYYFA